MGGQLTLREGRHLLSVMELAASMASLSSVVIILFVVCATAWCNGVTSSTFMMTKDKQLPSKVCQEVGGSRRMSRVQCAGACGVTAGCHSFSFTCADLHLGSSCRCFVCSAADLDAASTSLEATSGVLTSQVILQSLSSETTPMAPTKGAPQTTTAISTVPTTAISTEPTTAISTVPTTAISPVPSTAISTEPTTAISTVPTTAISTVPTTAISTEPTTAISTEPTTAISTVPTTAISTVPTTAISTVPTTQPTTQPTTTATETTSAPEPTTAETTTPGPSCPPPPLIDRTTVTHTTTPTHDVGHYACSVSTDVYVQGVVDVTCKDGATWTSATILCAPTTCWYTHPTYGPVYAGNLSHTADGTECQAWALNHPYTKKYKFELDSMYPSDNNSKTAASNYCRIFTSDSHGAWCYWTKQYNYHHWAYCNVNRCEVVPGQRLPQTKVHTAV